MGPAGSPKNNRRHDTPFALDFVPMSDYCSASEEEAKNLETVYNIDFTS
jgi:hypothetical protein